MPLETKEKLRSDFYKGTISLLNMKAGKLSFQ